MNNGLESIIKSKIDRSDQTLSIKESLSVSELTESIERFGTSEIKKPDISFIERTARIALFTMEVLLILFVKQKDSVVVNLYTLISVVFI